MAPKDQNKKKKVDFEENDPEDMRLDDKPAEDIPQAEKIAHSDSPQGTITSNESLKRKSGGPRSVCAMYKVVVKKALGKKMKVTFNQRGIPNGSSRHTLQSYIGMLARTMVPITIPSWPEVDSELKQKIWLDVQDTFKVQEESRSLLLKSAGCKWRQFKTTLTNEFILPFIGQKKKLSKPPKQYAFVGRDTWKKFVAVRTSDDWMGIHKIQSERVSNRKYPHRTSRKGYIGLEEEEVRSGKLEEGEEPDRAIMWKKARIPKENKDEIDAELAEKFNTIDSLLEQKRKGEFKPCGSQDVLSTALKKPEHSGRVRGVGGFVTPTTYFNIPRGRRVRITKAELLARDRERTEEMERNTKIMMEEIAKLKAMITSTSNIQSPILSDKASFHPEKDQVLEPTLKPEVAKVLVMDINDDGGIAHELVHPEIPKVPLSCQLAVGSIENKVAFGIAFHDKGNMNDRIHGKPMPTGCVRVSVDGIIDGEALLPVPVPGEMERVKQAIGSHVAWPKDLIIFLNSEKKDVPQRKKKELRKKFQYVQQNENVPKPFRLMHKHASTYMTDTGEAIQLPCDVSVFGVPKTIFLLSESILELLEYRKLGQAVIATYMMYLHTLIRDDEELSSTFGFVDPGITYKVKDDLETYIVKRLNEGNPDRIFFVPHNQKEHWILSIMWESDIYILNPLSHPIHFPELEQVLVRAAKTFNAQTGRGNKTPTVKNLAGSPKQPGGHECAYVVMRYMKDIIQDKELKFTTKWMTKTRKSYTREQLDEVRIETLQYIQDHMFL